MWVLVAEQDNEIAVGSETGLPLQQAFAQICCLAGCGYHFEQEQEGWRLVLTDGERPECSPEPIVSTYIKRADAMRDLMSQAVDGRLKGYVAIPLEMVRQQRALSKMMAKA